MADKKANGKRRYVVHVKKAGEDKYKATPGVYVYSHEAHAKAAEHRAVGHEAKVEEEQPEGGAGA